jgi:hypothetical protein
LVEDSTDLGLIISLPSLNFGNEPELELDPSSFGPSPRGCGTPTSLIEGNVNPTPPDGERGCDDGYPSSCSLRAIAAIGIVSFSVVVIAVVGWLFR